MSNDRPEIPSIAERRGWPDAFPVSGAWRATDDPGTRKFFTAERSLALEGGDVLESVTLAYETWGTLAEDASNAILICHALTGDSHVTGGSGGTYTDTGWWAGIVGPGLAIDTDRYFVVCVNVLGGCQGSTGPSSIDPATGKPYGSSFPQITNRDIARSQVCLADELGIDRWFSIVGLSLIHI